MLSGNIAKRKNILLVKEKAALKAKTSAELDLINENSKLPGQTFNSFFFLMFRHRVNSFSHFISTNTLVNECK